MFDMHINLDLDSGAGIDEAIKDIKEVINTINSKMQMVAERLADIGIEVATQNAGDDYSGYIVFQKQVTSQSEGECTVCMYADNSGELIRYWDTRNGQKSAVVNAVMMNEVGSGWFAENPDGLSDAGQGTFPGQKHAFSPKGWYWVDGSGKHRSFGENGHLSMHNAYITMQQEIDRVVSEVFG